MVYVKSWQEYQARALELYKAAPAKARYCVKWRAKKGDLVLKVTDDNTCLKYKTQSAMILTRFDILTRSLAGAMANVPERPPTPPPAAPAAAAAPEDAEKGPGAEKKLAQGQGQVAGGDGAAGGAGGGKKKKGKKKK